LWSVARQPKGRSPARLWVKSSKQPLTVEKAQSKPLKTRRVSKPYSEDLNMEGQVKWYNRKKGFGFVTGEDGQDYFVHHSQLAPGQFLRENDRVEFEATDTDKGKQAQKVVRLEGGAAPVEETPEEQPVEEAAEASEEQPVEEAPKEEPVEEAPKEEPVEETPEEQPVEEAAEAPEEKPVEEAPAEQ